MNLQQFLNKNKVSGLTEEVPISDRLRDENGKLYMAKIKVVDGKEYNQLNNQAVEVDIKTKKVKVNKDLVDVQLVLNYCEYPNFKSAEDIKAAGCVTPEQYLRTVLLPGEIQSIANSIRELSGLNESIEELEEEVKNY